MASRRFWPPESDAAAALPFSNPAWPIAIAIAASRSAPGGVACSRISRMLAAAGNITFCATIHRVADGFDAPQRQSGGTVDLERDQLTGQGEALFEAQVFRGMADSPFRILRGAYCHREVILPLACSVRFATCPFPRMMKFAVYS